VTSDFSEFPLISTLAILTYLTTHDRKATPCKIRAVYSAWYLYQVVRVQQGQIVQLLLSCPPILIDLVCTFVTKSISGLTAFRDRSPFQYHPNRHREMPLFTRHKDRYLDIIKRCCEINTSVFLSVPVPDFRGLSPNRFLC
jgi:hypothetical protein